MQSVRAGAVQTHFFIFTFFLKIMSSKTSFGLHFGDGCLKKMQFLVKQKLQKVAQKKCPDRLKQDSIPKSRGSWTATPKVKDFLSKKQQSEQEAII